MTAPKPSAHTAAQLRVLFGANPCQNPGHADPPCTWNQRAAQLDDLLAAARAEAVAPVLAVLRQLVEAQDGCVSYRDHGLMLSGVTCGAPATVRGPGTSSKFCDEHRHEWTSELPAAKALRAALALLAAHNEGT